MSHNVWIWVAALLTLAIYSFLYKDNPFYRFAEHLFLGVSVGYSMVILWYTAVIPRVWIPLKVNHQYSLIFPIILGAMIFSIFTTKWSWVIKYPLAFYVGAWSGIAIPLSFEASIFKQLESTVLTPNVMHGWAILSYIIMFVGVVATLIYFFFSKEHKGAIGKTARIGIIYIMIALGASFGYTVMARISLLIGRMQFLLHNWLGLIK